MPITFSQVIEREELQKNALEVGTYFLKSLEQLRSTSSVVGDVRGQVSFDRLRFLLLLLLFFHCWISIQIVFTSFN